MGQEQSQSQPHSARTFHYQSTHSIQKQIKNKRSIQHIEHEGILKLRSTPFPNCAQISNDGVLMFLQNAQTTLYELLQDRYYTNRLFPVDDIQRLIENVIYTLAYLAENNFVYRDLCPENIYYSHGMFKLLPNQLIQERFYERAWDMYYGLHNQNRTEQEDMFPYLSPQLVIALRMKQKNVQDIQILNKSNVFILGLILLQSTTLMPSSECYDLKTYDIFNNIISERLDLVEEHYNQCIARIIANMLDYDFNQRMDLKQLSIWVNRQLSLFRKDKQTTKNFQTAEDKKLAPNKSTMTIHKSRLITQEPNKCENITLNINTNLQSDNLNNANTQNQNRPTVNRTKTNIVYINGYDDGTARQDSKYNQTSFRGSKNNVYLQNFPQYEVDYQIDKKIQEKHDMVALANMNDYRDYVNTANINRNQPRFKYQYQREDHYHRPAEQSFQQPRLSRNYQKVNNQRVDYVPYPPPPLKSSYLREVDNIKQKILIQQQPQYKKRSDRGYDKAINISEAQQTPKLPKPPTNKKFYPSISEMQNMQKQQQVTKRVPKNSDYMKNMNSNDENSRIKQSFQSKQSKQSDSKCSANDGSINRIKMQIEKSRKLIQQFRKCQGISHQ